MADAVITAWDSKRHPINAIIYRLRTYPNQLWSKSRARVYRIGNHIRRRARDASVWSGLWIMIWAHRPGGKNPATSGQPVWPKSVTYVSGTICYLCVRAGPPEMWRRGWDLNPLGH
jgi:hypothetical protein